ncbi:MAG: endolytic transglycosylase MltG [Candidatus Adiutrix sp.]|jgi:UPF0755 protein|nr:endolytic transglycosylase MltG [Candidatus Adiutrix sp.]
MMQADKNETGGGTAAKTRLPLTADSAPSGAAGFGEKKAKTGPGCLSRVFGAIGIVVVLALIFAFLAGLKYSTLFLPPEEESREIVVPIPEGASADRIGLILEEKGVIKSAWAWKWAFRIKAKISKKPVTPKAGEMILDPSLSVWQNIDRLTQSRYIKAYGFTVPEGRNMFEIAKMAEAAGLGSGADFLALCLDRNFIGSLGLEVESLEGYLFPETYSFPAGTPLKNIIKTMTDQFFNVWKRYDDLAAQSGLSRHEVLTLASIVEKETGAANERPLIAGVFLNRLAKGMRLETDPTVIYNVADYDGNITRKLLQTPHPYNTYIIQGLPPGPIANPGEAAISAVLKPMKTKHYFFVSKNDGTHHFSETLAEHNRMVNKYQRGGGKKN